MKKNFISYFLLLKLISFSLNYEIYEQNVENCQKYTCEDEEKNCQKEEIKKCSQCNDKYFPFLKGLLCLPCDDPTYGNVGCGGNCDGSNYEDVMCEKDGCKDGSNYDYFNTRNVICEKDGCKDGYFNLDGICLPCSYDSENCAKCSYSLNNDFVCLDCFNKTEYKLINGKCEYCWMPNCKLCYYEKIK